MQTLKGRVYQLLDGSDREDVAGRVVNLFLVCLILANVLAVIFESVDSVGRRYAGPFRIFEVFSVIVFTVEYVLRIWSCTERPHGVNRGPIADRLRFAVTPMAIIDFLAVAPFYLSILFAIDLRFLRVFRLLRLFKMTRYSPAIEMLGRVLYNERRALLSVMLIMIVLLVFTASLMHLFEHQAQPEAFSSIPAAMWWAVVTLTTVGYGDVVPVTVIGKLLGGFVTILGVGAFAMPAGLLASGFAEEIKRRDFIISWDVVARVPLFGSLNARQIAAIARLLRPRIAVPNEVIAHRGDVGDAMYFIVGGRVEVVLEPESVELMGGDFFGEISLVEQSTRNADVIAVTSCQLLALRAHDFQDLMEQSPAIQEIIRKTARERMGRA
ncbi:MAG: cyclic nucleotide-gated ion channel [Alphaproteobacteria bacterium]